MRVKDKKKIYCIILFSFLIFEFSVVFLFTNINFENSFSGSNLGFEENTGDDGYESYNNNLPQTNSLTARLRPNGDILTEWGESPLPHWSKIDEETPDTTYVTWIDGNENQSEIFAMGIGNVEEVNIKVTQVDVHIRGFRYWTGPPNVSVYLGEWTNEIIVLITTYKVGTDEWISCNWSNLSGTYEDLKDLRVKIKAGYWCSANGYCQIDTLYCVVTYEVLELNPGKIKLRPNEDLLTEWDGSPTPHWSKIDEETPDTTYIKWIDGNENQTEIFGFESAYFDYFVVRDIKVYIRGFRYWTGPPNVSVYLGEWTDEITVPITSYNVGTDEWISCSWSNLSGTYEDLKDLRVKIKAGNWCNENGYCQIDTLYCEVTIDIPLEIAVVDQYSISNTSLDDLSINKDFNQEWVQQWGGNELEELTDMAMDSQGNVYVTGFTLSYGFGKADMVLIKYNTSGIKEWVEYWGGGEDDKAFGVAIDSNDDIYITGHSNSSNYAIHGKEDVALVKYDSSGNFLGYEIWGGPENERANSIAISSSNTIWVVGYSESFGDPNGDIVLINFEPPMGDQITYNGWGQIGNYKDEAFDIALDSFDNIYITGYSELLDGINDKDLVLLKARKDGEYIWNRKWSGNGNDIGNAIAVDNFDNIFITGETESQGEGSSDILILKYNYLGEIFWSKTWGTPDYEAGMDIGYDSLGYLYIVGNANNTLLEFDVEGNFKWAKTSNTGKWKSSSCIIHGLSNQLGSELLYVGGLVDDDFGLIKYHGKSNIYSNDKNDFKLIWKKMYPSIEFIDALNGYGRPEIAIDSSNNIIFAFISDITYYNVFVNIVKFDSEGNLIWSRSWVGSAIYLQLVIVVDLTIDPDDNIYLAVFYTDTVTLIKFDANGNYKWEEVAYSTLTNEPMRGLLNYPRGSFIAIDSHNNIYLPVNNYIRKYSSSGDQIKSYDAGGIIRQIAIDSSDNLYLFQTFTNLPTEPIPIMVFDTNLVQINSFFTQGIVNLQSSIAFDSSDNVYITTSTGVEKYMQFGTSLLFEIGNIYPEEFFHYFYPQEITIDSLDNLYVISRFIMWKYNSEGYPLCKIIIDPNVPTFFDPSYKIVVDSNENIYITTYNELRKYGHKIPLEIKFSLRKNHDLTINSKLVLQLSDFLNPHVDSYLKIVTEDGSDYGQFSLPFSDTPTDVSMEIPIFKEKLFFKAYTDGTVYQNTIIIYENDLNYDLSEINVDSINLYLEDEFSQEGSLIYDSSFGYIDFGLDVSSYRGTSWKGARVEVHMPKYSILKEFYGVQDDIFYDQFWTINRIEFPYGDVSFELNLPYGYYHENHVLYINDTNINDYDGLKESLNPFTYRIFFDKKPLEMSLYIQNPNQELVDELIISDPGDYNDHSLYCRIYDPTPLLGLTDVPYFIASDGFHPLVNYYIDNSFIFEGLFSELGINTQEFIWNLAGGKFDFSSSLENIFEPVYNTNLFNYSQFTIFEQSFFDISYDSDPLYMGSTLDFGLNLLDPDGEEIGQNITVLEENANWIGHESISLNLNQLANYSGNYYHFEMGYPSSSLYLANDEPAYTLLNVSYPSTGLIFTPEILEYNPLTKSSEQELEIYIILDLSEIIQTYNLDPSKDFSLIKATIFGASFIDTLQNLGEIEDAYGRIEIYNSFLDDYETLLLDNLYEETLEQENPNNALRLEGLSKYQFERNYEDDIGRYIDPQNRITVRLSSYFKGNISDPNTYLSNFDKPNAVLGALIDFVEFELVWWNNVPELTSYSEVVSKITPTIFSFTPTAPGTYNITFEYNNESSYYYSTKKIIEITVERCPVQISLDISSDGFSTGTTTLTATVINQLTDTPAADAKVLFFSNNTVDEIGFALTDANGIATFITNSITIGDHLIWAETIPNNGKYIRPYIDEPFPLDRWALNNSNSQFISIALSQSQLELISLAPENHNLIVEQEFLIYPKLMDTHASKEIYDENIDIFINDNFYGTFLSSKPFLLSFLEPGDYFVEGFYAGTPILNESYDSVLFKAKRLMILFSDISPEEYMYFPNQTITFNVTAFDLTTETFVNDLPIYLYTNITGILASGITNPDGNATITMMIDEGWCGKDILVYAMNAPISDLYLEQRTSYVSISVRPYNVSLALTINETELFVNEFYEFTFQLWNEDLKEFIEDETLDIYIYKDDIIQDYFSITTVLDDRRVLAFDTVGEYSIEIVHEETTLYMRVIDTFSIEGLKRPTYISLEITDKDLVPGNEFSITVFLVDALNNESISMKYLNVSENIYDDGFLVVSKYPFEVYTGYTNTFLWSPLREAEFEFIFSFYLEDLIYQNSNYSIILSVKKRQVLIDSIIDSVIFKVGDIVQINSRFIDLNTTNWDLIPGLEVRYLIQNGSNVLYSEILTTDESGIINFEWQIPLDLVNTEFNITLITATSNVYHWNYELFELSTSTIDTYFIISKLPPTINYLDEESLFTIGLQSILGNNVIDLINYEINSTQLSFYSSGIIDLGLTSELSITLSELGKYTIKFYFNGTNIYSATQTEIILFIELRPALLELYDYPEFIYQNQQSINLKYRLIDKSTGLFIENSMIKLYYIDFDTSTKIYLDTLDITDANGEVSFIVDIPLNYPYSTLAILAEANKTTKNDEAFNSYEMEITNSPTFINLNAGTNSLLFYLNDTLKINFELFDYYNALLLTEELLVEIGTPSSNHFTLLRCNQSITLNFTELGIYRISVLYEGNVSYLPSSAHLYYLVSPIPTVLEFIEPIPTILYSDQYLYLKTQLRNNLTDSPLGDELVIFYLSDGTTTYPIYTNFTDENGFITFVWEVNESLIDQNIEIFTIYNYVHDYQNSSTPIYSIQISKYYVEIDLLEFPVLLTPFTESSFIIKAFRQKTGEYATGCHLKVNLIYLNGSTLLLIDSFSNSEGIIEFNWTPHRPIFNFNEIIIEISLIEDSVYYGELLDTKLVIVEKLSTFLNIDVDRYQVLPNDIIHINFHLSNVFNETLEGHLINVSISNVLYSTNFTIIIGFNDTFDFIIPNYGAFEMVGLYKGTDRYHQSSNETVIYSDKFELEIELSILEAFAQNQMFSFLGTHWNYSILDYHQNFTLVANVSIKQYSIPMEGAEVYFYFIQKSGDLFFIGSNVTNKDGIAIYYWDTSNFSSPNWWHSSALLAKVPESLYNYPSESNPIYFSLRKINTFIAIETFTSEFRVNIDYKINISLYDEFLIKLKGYNISVNIYFRGKIVDSYNIITNNTSYFNFTPSKCGNYIIKAHFAGTEEYKACRITEKHKCVEKEPTNLKIFLSDKIQPGQLYSIKVILFNSTGGLLIGELVDLTIMYHDEAGNNQYYYVNVIIGENDTFDWIFPEYDEYVIKALYRGSDDYLGCKVVTQSKALIIFSFSLWELFFLFLGPGLMICPSFERKGKKNSKWKKRKKILAALLIIFAFLGANYASIATVCSQIETTGLIGDVNIESNYDPENPALSGMTDLFEFGASFLNQVPLDLIPNQENPAEDYDYIIENSTIIPPEADVSPPSLNFEEIAEEALLTETVIIKVAASDKESYIEKVLFKLLYQGVTLVNEGEFDYNETLGLYIYELNTGEYQDGDYDIQATAFDSNNNEESIYINVEISNNPDFEIGDIETDLFIVELTDYINVSFTSLVSGFYTLRIRDVNLNPITTLFGEVKENELNLLTVPIEPLYYKEGNYLIQLTIMIEVLGIQKAETQDFKLTVKKESVNLELDVVEDEDIFTDHPINLRARLVENDYMLSPDGDIVESELVVPLSGKILSFEISDSDNYQFLGTTITDSNGYATFNYKVDLSQGNHLFNVTYQGSNVYQPLETFRLFENQGKPNYIFLADEIDPVPYNTIGSISARFTGDVNAIPNTSLYFNISNSNSNVYLGMAETDEDGIATILFPCNHLPGIYDVIVYSDGNSVYANNLTIFEDSLEIIKENSKLSIVSEGDAYIVCPLKYETEIASKLVINDTYVGIKDIPIIYELLYESSPIVIGTSLTDSNGFSTIQFNPNSYNLIPGTYLLIIYIEENIYYTNVSSHIYLNISKDAPILSVEGTEVYFSEAFQLNASLTDSLLNPLINKELNFYAVNSSDESYLYLGKAETNENGLANLYIPENKFNSTGVFDIVVQFPGDLYGDSVYTRISDALVIHYRETKLIIQGQEEQIPIKHLDIEILLIDSNYQPIEGQEIYLECYRINSTVNLLGSRISVRTNASGIALYSLPLLLPDDYILYAYYQPQLDGILKNDGYLDSEAVFKFEIVRIAANLMIKHLSKPYIMRGDILDITVVSESEAAKDYLIPVRIFLDGANFDHVDILDLMTIKQGVGRFSYEIPLGSDFQAGIYNFSIEIEPGTFFEGNTSFSIDLRERTTLKISYNILNPRAAGYHYIWEKEEILFTLIDEDGKPLPIQCENKLVDRLIKYQIINGQYVTDIKEPGLLNGSFSIFNTPKAFGNEFCIANNNGSRFFLPAYQKRSVKVFRRPLNLIYLQYSHDNPNRLELPYTGHRGETLLIEALVQDYLNETFRPYHKVDFGYNGMLKKYYAISDGNGYVKIEVPLNSESGLIQADSYNPFIKIKMTSKFQSIANFSLELLQILEFGRFACSVGPITTKDMNYVINPTITYYDEDNKPISNFPFYIRFLNKETNEIYVQRYMNSSKVEIAITQGGDFVILITITPDKIGYSESEDLIAIYMISKTLIVALKEESTLIKVWSPLIVPFYIPLFSDLILPALWQSIKWQASGYTIAIWFILFVLFGREKIELTTTSFIQFLILVMVLKLCEVEDTFWNLFIKLGILATLHFISDVMTGTNWLFSAVFLVIELAIGLGMAYALRYIEYKLTRIFLDPNKNLGEMKDNKKNWPDAFIILIELLFTAGYGIYVLAYKALGWMVTPISWVLEWAWGKKREWAGDIEGSPSKLLTLLYLVIKFAISMLIDFLIPKPKPGNFFGFLIEIARTILKISLTLIITAAIALVSGPVSTIFSMVVRKLIEFFIAEIFGTVLSLVVATLSIPYSVAED